MTICSIIISDGIVCEGNDSMKEMTVLSPQDMVRQVVATMAVEDMYLSKDFIGKLEKIATEELSSEEVRQEVIKKYARC